MVEAARLRCPDHGNTIAARFQSEDSIWIRNPSAALFRISHDGTNVDVYADEPCDENFLALALISEVSVFLLQMQGVPTLHASAVGTSAGALVFVGPSGQGKSTIAASLLRRGFPLATDDNLPLRLVHGRVLGGPSVPMMKILDDTAQHASVLRTESDCLTWGRKKVVPLDEAQDFVDEAVPVRAVYLLSRYTPESRQPNEISITDIAAQPAINVLLAQTSYGALFLPREVARFLPLYARLVRQVSVRMLAYPDGFEYVDAVCDSILRDVGIA